MSGLDLAYRIDRAPLVSAHALGHRPRERLDQAEQDPGYRPMRFDLRIQGRAVTWIGVVQGRVSDDTARTNAIVQASRTDQRMRTLVRATPSTAPDPSTRYDADGRTTHGAEYAWRLAAFARRYICLVDAPGRPRP